jgi:tetratricopeptide (TPR) repeat protein
VIRSKVARISRIAVALSCLGGVAAGPARAEAPASMSAEEEARGRELYDNGALLYEEGRYEDAIFAWTEGYRLSGRSGFLYNIANAQERLGRYAEALDTLGRYRALARADEREVLDRRIRSLEDRLGALPPAPVPAPVPAPDRDPPLPEPLPGGGGGRAGRTIVGSALLSVGAVGLGVGAAFGLRSRAAGREAESVCVDGSTGLLCPGSAGGALRVNRQSALVADLGLLGGVLAGVGGAVVLSTGDRRAADGALTLVAVHRSF